MLMRRYAVDGLTSAHGLRLAGVTICVWHGNIEHGHSKGLGFTVLFAALKHQQPTRPNTDGVGLGAAGWPSWGHRHVQKDVSKHSLSSSHAIGVERHRSGLSCADLMHGCSA